MVQGIRRKAALLVAAAMFVATLAACGDDDDSTAASADDTPQATSTTAEPSSTIEGCGEGASTDIDDLSAERQPARCDAGFPAPQPLATPTKIVLANAFKSEYVAPIILADQLGEFAKENLEVEIVSIGLEDALPQMRNGTIDAANGAPNASVFNADAGGLEVRWVLGNFFPPSAGDTSVPQTGLWARRDIFSDPDEPDLRELEGRRVASAVGLASVIAYPIAQAFDEAGADFGAIEFTQVPSTDMVAALENDAVDAAWLLDPFWTQLQDSPDFMLVATQPPGEPLGGIFFGERLLGEDREAGKALIRALIRTVNTYLDGDYHTDDTVMNAIAEITAIPVERIRATPALQFDWEIRGGTIDRAQQYFRQFGVLNYDHEIPEDDLVDRSLYLEVVGAA